MKLTRCYIENFGTLRQFELNFDGGVAVIKAPNGYGKSTFAAFIRAMLYGFPRGNKANLEKDHRRKYAPWQGGRFGGCIEFELEGSLYRVERFFGDKPTQDSFALYELPEMRPSSRFSENLGTELFGVDAESFERSTYMSALSETGTLSTDSILSRLSNLVEDTGDSCSCEKAAASLKKARMSLVPYRGSGGEVYAASDKISALQSELASLSAERERLPALYEEIAELESNARELNASAEELRAELIRASKQSERLSLAREKSGLIRRKNAIEAEKAELLEDYPKGIPSLEELGAVPAEREAPAEKKSVILTVFLILAAFCCIAGIAVIIALKSYALGGVIISIALLLAAAGLYFHYRIIADAIEEREKENALYDLEKEKYLILRDGALRLEELDKRLLEIVNELKEFEALHPDADVLELSPEADGDKLAEEYGELGRTLPELSRRIAEKRREAELLEEKTARLAEKENALEHYKAVKSEGLRTAQELDSAIEYLYRAKETLSKGYMSKIESGFVRYLNSICEEQNGRIFVGSDLDVKLERGGEARSLEYFSAGFSDIVMLCMRLALIDALYGGEKPFIIMDDPFINLDDEHTKKAIELVNSIGREYQVIYLTCNSSRT